jgi:hypothetical protein
MKAFTRAVIRSLSATAIALPLAVSAQTTTTTPTSPKGLTPADQPTSQTEKDAQTRTGQSSKYGTQGTASATTTTNSTRMHRGMKHDTMKKSGTTEPGDATTYPAPAKDGTPTKQGRRDAP